MNLILASRSQDKLDKAAQELQQENPNIKIQTKAINLCCENISDYKQFIEEQTQQGNKDVRILVNNVGIYERKKFFDMSP